MARNYAKTVRFFEVLDREMNPLPDLPWDQVLDNLRATPVEERTVSVHQEEHLGTPWFGPPGSPDMLLLSKIRDSSDLPDLLDRSTGELEPLELAETKGLAETSQVVFFPLNIVGMIRSMSSPSTVGLSSWLGGMELLQGAPALHVAPLSRVNITAKLDDVDQARSIRVKMRTSEAGAIAGGAPTLADVVTRLEETFGPVVVEMKISIPQDKGFNDVSERLQNEAAGLIALAHDGRVPDLQAFEMRYRSLAKERADEIDFLQDKLAEKVTVEILDEEGRAVRHRSAADAIQRAYAHLKADLEAAAGRDRG